jgi:hypothetical protein
MNSQVRLRTALRKKCLQAEATLQGGVAAQEGPSQTMPREAGRPLLSTRRLLPLV